jgi:hypothetical protein
MKIFGDPRMGTHACNNGPFAPSRMPSQPCSSLHVHAPLIVQENRDDNESVWIELTKNLIHEKSSRVEFGIWIRTHGWNLAPDSGQIQVPVRFYKHVSYEIFLGFYQGFSFFQTPLRFFLDFRFVWVLSAHTDKKQNQHSNSCRYRFNP